MAHTLVSGAPLTSIKGELTAESHVHDVMMQKLATLKRSLDAGIVTNAEWQSRRDAAIALRCCHVRLGESRSHLSDLSLSRSTSQVFHFAAVPAVAAVAAVADWVFSSR